MLAEDWRGGFSYVAYKLVDLLLKFLDIILVSFPLLLAKFCPAGLGCLCPGRPAFMRSVRLCGHFG